jgi:hypothetical protein
MVNLPANSHKEDIHNSNIHNLRVILLMDILNHLRPTIAMAKPCMIKLAILAM